MLLLNLKGNASIIVRYNCRHKYFYLINSYIKKEKGRYFFFLNVIPHLSFFDTYMCDYTKVANTIARKTEI